MIAIVQVVWICSLVGVFIVFAGCMLYLWDWGEKTDENWGCPTWPGTLTLTLTLILTLTLTLTLILTLTTTLTLTLTLSQGVAGNSTCCTCADGALTYKVEDYWNEKMTQVRAGVRVRVRVRVRVGVGVGDGVGRAPLLRVAFVARHVRDHVARRQA